MRKNQLSVSCAFRRSVEKKTSLSFNLKSGITRGELNFLLLNSIKLCPS